jgi:2-C-methyl-D-erythritol 2,4-cyclodiphosphate synthase
MPKPKITRSGIGYDVHRLEQGPHGRLLVLGGVPFHHDQGLTLAGHSDADVLCHAIADALLGAAGLQDIGHYFPNTDASIKDISSLEILRRVSAIIADNGGTIINVDSTLVAEEPKISPYVLEMREKIAGALGLDTSRVGVKATTNECLGFLGRGEGIAALATSSVETPSD